MWPLPVASQITAAKTQQRKRLHDSETLLSSGFVAVCAGVAEEESVTVTLQ